jgi:transcriptional regulator with XRE-family HTH domain
MKQRQQQSRTAAISTATKRTIRELRKDLGISQLELAVRAETSLVTVSMAERSGRVSPDMAARFARALGVSVDQLDAVVGVRR